MWSYCIVPNPFEIHNMQDNNICGICQDDIVNKTSLNSCSHSFCFTCIARWSQESNSCPLCQARYNELRPSEKNKKDVKVKNVDRREKNWMEVMEQYDSEEESIDSEEDFGSEADCYEEDFAVPDGVVVYEDGTIVDERDEDDFVPNGYGRSNPKQKDSIITTNDGQTIKISWMHPKTVARDNDVDEYDEDGEFVPRNEEQDEDDEEEEDFDDDEGESSFENSDESNEVETRGRVLYQPQARAAKQGRKRYAE